MFTMGCSDGTTLHPAGVEELLEFPNPKSREIRTIEISTWYKAASRCQIMFSDDILGPARYTVSGEDAFVVSTADIIEQHLESMNGSGPQFIAASHLLKETAGALLAGPAVLLILLGFASSWDISVSHAHPQIGSLKIGGLTSAATLTAGLILLSVALKFERLLKYFFPKVSFCMGDGAARYARMVEMRKLFGLSALVALLLGILAGWVTNMLPTR